MKETGLMFKAPLVRALLDGSKTQTRRVVKWKGLKPGLNLGFSGLGVVKAGSGWALESSSRTSSEWRCQPTPSPVGQPGDRIYVRETWQGPLLEEFESDADSDWMSASRIHQYQNPAHCQYAADGGPTPEFMTADDDLVRRWRPAIHMPKWAARIWLEITAVRVERLRQITEADCIAEGIAYDPGEGGVFHEPGFAGCSSDTATGAFQKLWESTGGDWAANPWVWVIDFKAISTTGRPA